MLLELDDRTASIPWELLDTRGNDPSQVDDRPWAIRTQLLRKLRQEDFRQQVQDAQPDDAVLVIGEPAVDESAYPPLPGARAEAQAVADAFSGPGGLGADRVNALVDGNEASSIINALFERRYRIVHVAGHGEPVTRDAAGKLVALGGVVLSDGTFLGPDEIRSMRTVPELVFVNCCHLAARDSGQTLKAINRAEFAWGVADSLISIGVRCVIAAGWAVDDGPAKVFATTFYREVLAGRPFIQAVAAAREAAWNEDRSSQTWAAYQAYGDPNWVYRRGTVETLTEPVAPREEFDGVSSPLGLALALEEQAVKSKWMRADPVVQLEKIRHLEARFAALWGGMGAIAEAFGLAYAEAGDADKAIAWYQHAVQCNDSSASMKAQEQLGNLRARRAWDQASRSNSAAALARARQEIRLALESLQALAQLQPTLERHSLHGSAWKRLALVERRAGDQAAEQSALSHAATAYTQAEDLARRQGEPLLFYPALNRMALELVAQAGNPRWAGFGAGDAQAVRANLLAKEQHDPDFWCYAGLVELDIYEALARRALAAALDGAPDSGGAGILTRYTELHARVSALSLWGSVADTAGLVLQPYAAAAGKAEAAAAQRLLALLKGFASG
jgi:tetratricopeptide (TPR) repeat protein